MQSPHSVFHNFLPTIIIIIIIIKADARISGPVATLRPINLGFRGIIHKFNRSLKRFKFCYGNVRLRSGNACYHSGQNLLSSRLLSKNVKIKIYRPIILPVVLYGCETWSLTLLEERKLRVFENMVLRRILGPRREEVTGEWRRLHNEELNDLYP